jgi:hypothetical protein
LKTSSEVSRRSFLRGALGVASLACVLATSASCAPAQLPDSRTAAALLEQFRRSIWAEPIYAEFELRQMPRRGKEHAFRGRFWGSRNYRGPATRLEIDVGKGGFTHRFLVQGGADGGIWTADGTGAGIPDDDAMLAPLAPGVEMTPFDVLPMPYLYWLDSELVSVERIRGRPADIYVFLPSADFSARHPAVKSVRAYLDAQYDALEQSEIAGADGRVSKTLSLLELRKVGDRWIPKDLDVRNESTRDKTRLSLTAVAIGFDPGAQAFNADGLGSALPPPPAARVIRIAP